MIIGIRGRKQSGKNTVASMLQYCLFDFTNGYTPTFDSWKTWCGDVERGLIHPSWEIRSFAGKLKQFVALLTGCQVEDLESDAFKNSPLPYSIATLNVGTYRELLQKLGTDIFRDQVDRSLWVKALMIEYTPFRVTFDNLTKSIYPNWIISDVRFPNELHSILEKKGVIVHVARPQSLPFEKEHISETALDYYQGKDKYSIINNSDLETLFRKVLEMSKDIIKTSNISKETSENNESNKLY